MRCPNCGVEIEVLKKYKIYECVCGGKLMCIEIKKKKELIDLKEENKC